MNWRYSNKVQLLWIKNRRQPILHDSKDSQNNQSFFYVQLGHYVCSNKGLKCCIANKLVTSYLLIFPPEFTGRQGTTMRGGTGPSTDWQEVFWPWHLSHLPVYMEQHFLTLGGKYDTEFPPQKKLHFSAFLTHVSQSTWRKLSPRTAPLWLMAVSSDCPSTSGLHSVRVIRVNWF